jgi:predicted HTH domain antitoxin
MSAVQLELDEDLVAVLQRDGGSVEETARELIVTELYRRGTISHGKAAELLGIPLEDFLVHAGRLGIPYFDFTEEEWEAEKRAVKEIAMAARSSATPVR